MKPTDLDRQDEATARAVLRILALKARGMSGADIERLVREARQKARRGHRQLVFSDIFDILASARPDRSQALRWRTAIHEAGHAVARLVLGHGRVISIGIDTPDGGYTEGRLPITDSETEALFDGLIAVWLAGRAAEEELLGSVTAGAGGKPDSDLAKATEMALVMETELGFAETWPLIYRPVDDRSSLLAYNLVLAERVNIRLEAAYDQARDVIRRNEDAVRFLADALMEHDTLEGTPLLAILADVRKRLNLSSGATASEDSVTPPIKRADAINAQADESVSHTMDVIPHADPGGTR